MACYISDPLLPGSGIICTLMDAISTRYTLDAEDYLNSARLATRPDAPTRLMLLVAYALASALLLALLDWKKACGIIVGLFAAYMLFFFFIQNVALPTMIRRSIQAGKIARTACVEMTLDDHGLSINQQTMIPWAAFYASRMDTESLLLYRTGAQYLVIPLRKVVPEVRPALQDICRRKLNISE